LKSSHLRALLGMPSYGKCNRRYM